MRLPRGVIGLALGVAWLSLAGSEAVPVAPGEALFRAGRYEEAEHALSRVAETDLLYPRARHFLGRIDLRFHRYDEAVVHLQSAVDGNESNPAYHLWLGRACAEKARTSSFLSAARWAMRWKRALESGFELDPEDLDLRGDLISYLLNAPRIGGGNKERGVRLARESVLLDPVRGRLLLAGAYSATGDPESAVQTYEETLRLAPHNTSAHSALGYHLLRAEKYEAAKPHFETYAQEAPSKPDAHDSLGDFYAAIGSMDEAIAQYEEALALDGQSSHTRFKLAQAYERKTMVSEAIRHYAILVDQTPEHYQANEAKKRLKALRR